MILFQMDVTDALSSGVVGQVKDWWTLGALIVLSIVYLITLFYKLKAEKKQSKDLTDSFESQTKELIVRIEMQNEKIVKRLEDIHDVKNNMDLQASMDIIDITFTKSMLYVMKGVGKILDDDFEDLNKVMICEKVKNIVESQSQEDLLILSRIFYKNVKLSHYVSTLDKTDIIKNITNKITSINDKKQYTDIMDYIKNKYLSIIQSIQIQLESN